MSIEAATGAVSLILAGSLVTLRIFLLSAMIAGPLAFLLGVLRTAQSVRVRLLATMWVEFFRGTSTVVQLFWLYFALPFLGVSLSAQQAAVIGLGVVHGAYASEVVRGAILAVPRSQWEAAQALMLPRLVTLRKVILPQALPLMLPPLGNSAIFLLKGTSIASIITVPELTFQSSLIVTRTMAIFQVMGCTLVIYYVLALLLVRLVRTLERRSGAWRPVRQTL